MTKKVRPFNVHKVRKVTFLPDHFESVAIAASPRNQSKIAQWIDDNLSNRYFVNRVTDVDQTNKITYKIKVGFEEAKEMSFFMIACPLLTDN